MTFDYLKICCCQSNSRKINPVVHQNVLNQMKASESKLVNPLLGLTHFGSEASKSYLDEAVLFQTPDNVISLPNHLITKTKNTIKAIRNSAKEIF